MAFEEEDPRKALSFLRREMSRAEFLKGGGALIVGFSFAGALVGSLHVPLHDLPASLGDLPRRTLWVHCGAGYRATVAAGILQRAGFDVVVLDDDWANAGRSALTVAPPTVASLAR